MTATIEPRVIHTHEDYERALGDIERLIALDPPKGSDDEARLDLLGVLVENYESKTFELPTPTPIEAIRFRMEEQGLVARDLEPFIGSRSKVYEVLSGKVPLSIRMVRELASGLGIPTDVLIQDVSSPPSSETPPEIPIREVVRRGWVEPHAKEKPVAVIERFLAPVGGAAGIAPLWRAGRSRGTSRVQMGRSQGAFIAWLARVLTVAKDTVNGRKLPVIKTIPEDVIAHSIKLSNSPQGPVEVCKFLLPHGIVVVTVPHLPRTKLDGCAVRSPEGHVVIGLTLRHDRLDSFWFTLVHELAHVNRHLNDVDGLYWDDLDMAVSKDPVELEADALAAEWLIPSRVWKRSSACRERTVEAILQLADDLRIHPAIVAGRIRRDTGNYHIFAALIGYRQVRRLFPGFSSEG